jgi:hypothetical protein
MTLIEDKITNAASKLEEREKISSATLPKRAGRRPKTTPWAPHIQQNQIAPPEMLTALAARVFALPDIEERPIHRADPPERGLAQGWSRGWAR